MSPTFSLVQSPDETFVNATRGAAQEAVIAVLLSVIATELHEASGQAGEGGAGGRLTARAISAARILAKVHDQRNTLENLQSEVRDIAVASVGDPVTLTNPVRPIITNPGLDQRLADLRRNEQDLAKGPRSRTPIQRVISLELGWNASSCVGAWAGASGAGRSPAL